MKIKNTIIAFVVLAVLGGLFYWVSRQPASNADQAPKTSLFSFQPDQVQEFTIEAPPDPPATIRRVAASGKTASTWQIVSPENVSADNTAIDSFLEELPGIQATPLVGDTAPVWTQYGLDQAARTYRFKLKDGKTDVVAIGMANPGGSSRYARAGNSSTVLMLDDVDGKSVIEDNLLTFRDKRILPVDLDQAQRMEVHLSSPPRTVILAKQASGNWDLDQPRLRTDHGAASYLFTTVSGGQINSVAAGNPASLDSFGLANPAIRFDITTPQGTTSLMVGKQEPASAPTSADQSGKQPEQRFYAKNSLDPQVFTIPRTVYDQLNQSPENYRNRSLFDFDTSNAQRIDIQGPSGNLSFEKKGDNWAKTAAPTQPGAKPAAGKAAASKTAGADQAKQTTGELKVPDFLDSMHSLRIASYPSDAPDHYGAFGLDKPWLTVRVTYGDNGQQETVIFSRKDGKFYAARQGEPSVYQLSDTEPPHVEQQLKDLAS